MLISPENDGRSIGPENFLEGKAKKMGTKLLIDKSLTVRGSNPYER